MALVLDAPRTLKLSVFEPVRSIGFLPSNLFCLGAFKLYKKICFRFKALHFYLKNHPLLESTTIKIHIIELPLCSMHFL